MEGSGRHYKQAARGRGQEGRLEWFGVCRRLFSEGTCLLTVFVSKTTGLSQPFLPIALFGLLASTLLTKHWIQTTPKEDPVWGWLHGTKESSIASSKELKLQEIEANDEVRGGC